MILQIMVLCSRAAHFSNTTIIDEFDFGLPGVRL